MTFPQSLIHDAGLYPWLVVAAYFAAAGTAVFAARAAGGRQERLFWLGTTLILLLLGLNKQLDLQTMLTDVAREHAKANGWYEQRRAVQGLFLAGLGAATVAAGLWLALTLRSATASIKVAAGGLLLLAAFVLMRAATFHHIDVWVTMDVGGLRRGWWLELAGNAVIGGAAVRYLLNGRRSGMRQRTDLAHKP